MKKKIYMKPTLTVVEMKQRTTILVESNEKMNKNEEEVDYAW